jgi:hypothetical protein
VASGRVGFIVTNMARPAANAVAFYNKRGTCERWIKEGEGAIRWTRLSCRSFAANAVRLQLHALAYNLGNFLRTLATPEPIKDWSLTSLKERLTKIAAKVVSHGAPLKHGKVFVAPQDRSAALTKCRNLKMAQSAHAYVRGNTVKYYEWLASLKVGTLPEGPPIWICGDCHISNLGPVANAARQVEIQIRDLDQTVIGNPSHDLVRLGLSLASAARGSDLPGVTTAKMLEELMAGYEAAFEHEFHEEEQSQPEPVKAITKQAEHASQKTFGGEPMKDVAPSIPLGKRFWPLTDVYPRRDPEFFKPSSRRDIFVLPARRT